MEIRQLKDDLEQMQRSRKVLGELVDQLEVDKNDLERRLNQAKQQQQQAMSPV